MAAPRVPALPLGAAPFFCVTLILAGSACHGPARVAPSAVAMGIVDSCPATAAASDVVSGQMPENQMPENRHVRLTPLRTGTAADSARAGQLVAEMRRALTKYQDVHIAE